MSQAGYAPVMSNVGIGEAACLAAALCWAIAVGQLRGSIADHGARAINLAKCLIAAPLMGLTALAAGQGYVLLSAPGRSLLFIALSGVVGMTLGDTALFAAVDRLGVHRTLLLQTLAPVFTALLAFGFRGERLTLGQLAGGAMILAGVALVVAPRRGRAATAAVPSVVPGVLLAVLAAFGQGAGVVLAKEGLDDLPLLAASALRLVAAAAGMVVVLLAGGRLGKALGVLASAPSLRRVAAPSVLGTYVAILLMMAGIAESPAAVAAVLLATTPVWSLLFEAGTGRAPLTVRGVGGTLLAVAGVGVLAASGG